MKMKGQMKVLKRNGQLENVSYDKILQRMQILCGGPKGDNRFSFLNKIDPYVISKKVIDNLSDGISTQDLDIYSSQICMDYSVEENQYSELALRIIVSNNHKSHSKPTFSEMYEILGNLSSPRISNLLKDNKIKNRIDKEIVTFRDYSFDYFGYKTLEKSYLVKRTVEGKLFLETPQQMFMRVSLGLHYNDLEEAFKTYHLLSKQYFTHATPTLFNSGTHHEQNSSCFLLGTEDSIKGMAKSYGDTMQISKWAGGIGMHISNIRASGSIIRGTNGKSDGIIPMLKVYNEIANQVNQGGKRKGSFAFYLEPWHADILSFLKIRNNTTDQELACRDLFTALWVPDLFMKCVLENSDWYLMCPDECPGLTEAYGKDFEELYYSYVKQGKYRQKIKAKVIWDDCLKAQTISGTPYLLYKDHVNRKNNQKNLGTIKSSNLCVAPETMILTSKGHFPIKELENQKVKVWNGEEFTETVPIKTGENQKLIKVNLSNGVSIECTEYHNFYIATGKRPSENPKMIKIKAKDLKKDMKLIKCSFPVIKEGSSDFPYPYEHGLFTADGTYLRNIEEYACTYKSKKDSDYCKYHMKMYPKDTISVSNTGICKATIKSNPILYLYGEKKKLVDHVTSRLEVLPEKNNRLCVSIPMEIKEKYQVPINYNLDIKLRWLEGLVDGDGCIIKSGKATGIQIGSIKKDFLENVRYLLQTLGCDAKIAFGKEKGYRMLPKNDGTGESKEFFCQESYRLLITSWDVARLWSLGFRPKRLKITGEYPKKDTRRWIKVESIEESKISDTFCFKEEKRGMGIFNGIILGNCSEINLYSDDKEYAVCNLASICLPKFLKDSPDSKLELNLNLLGKVTRQIVRNLNKVIDNNFYPVPETELSNKKNRPIGIGVQGLANLFYEKRIPFDSDEAKKLNILIFETIQYNAIDESIELAKKWGSYPSYQESPLSQGKFQHDLWEEYNPGSVSYSGLYDWDSLRSKMKLHGIRNSVLTTLPPTASTSQIMGNFESFEPINSNIFRRDTIAGDFTVVNKYLVKDLTELGIWNKSMKNLIIKNNGSIQNISEIPLEIRNLYKTVYELSQKNLIDLCVLRAPFIDQTQSMNLYYGGTKDQRYQKISSMFFYGWKKGLKTGVYYLRTLSSTEAMKFTVGGSNEEDCENCSA